MSLTLDQARQIADASQQGWLSRTMRNVSPF